MSLHQVDILIPVNQDLKISNASRFAIENVLKEEGSMLNNEYNGTIKYYDTGVLKGVGKWREGDLIDYD